MNGLKGTLIGIYAALALLLILLNLKGCHHETESRGRDTDTILKVDTIVQTDTATAAPNDTAVPENIEGQRGRLRVAMLWDFRGDADIHVVQPNGKCIDYHRKEDPSRGCHKDRDTQVGGPNSVENIYWDDPQDGVYTVYIHYYPQYATGNGPVKVVVQSSSGDRTIGEKAFNSSLTRPLEWRGICRFEYRNGQIKFMPPGGSRPSGSQCLVSADMQQRH